MCSSNVMLACTLSSAFIAESLVELGGQWVGPTLDRVLALAEELGVGLFPTYVEGEHFLAVEGEVKRYGGDDVALPEGALADVGETRRNSSARTIASTARPQISHALAGAERRNASPSEPVLPIHRGFIAFCFTSVERQVLATTGAFRAP
jgi:monoamine oxidase